MTQTAFSAQETVKKPLKFVANAWLFSVGRLHFEQNKNINSVDIDEFTGPD